MSAVLFEELELPRADYDLANILTLVAKLNEGFDGSSGCAVIAP